MGKIKVLQFPFSSNNGVTAYATNNWRYIDKSKFHFDFVVVRNHFNPVWEKKMLQSNAGIKELFYSAEQQPGLYAKRLREIFSEGYDVVHLHTSFWKRLTVEEIAVECKIPKIILHSHNTGVDSASDRNQAIYNRHCEIRRQFDLSYATDFCACSRAAAEWLFGEQVPKNRIQIMKNAIEVEKYIHDKEVRDQYRRNLGLDGSFVIGCVGRFSYQKNQEFLLSVFRAVTQRVPDAYLLLVGEGPMEAELKEQAQRLGIGNRVIFMGQRNDVPQLLQAMDVFCLPSRFEGLGIVLVEAQAAGLICFTSENIVNEVCITDHLIKLPFDPQLWSNAIASVSWGYQRKNMYGPITDAGYNLKFQIKNVEKLYGD